MPGAVSRTPSRRRCSSGVPTICSSRWICWLRVGWAMNKRSAARVKVPASATATKYRKCRSSRPCGACVSARGSRTGSACDFFMSVTYVLFGPGPNWGRRSPAPVRCGQGWSGELAPRSRRIDCRIVNAVVVVNTSTSAAVGTPSRRIQACRQAGERSSPDPGDSADTGHTRSPLTEHVRWRSAQRAGARTVSPAAGRPAWTQKAGLRRWIEQLPG